MALPTQYLVSTKNLDGILGAVRRAQAPKQFTLKFLESLGFASSADRLIVGVFKALGFLTDSAIPTPRYHEYLDETRSASVMAEAMRAAYTDLFQVNKNAQELSVTELRGKIKTLTAGQYSDNVIAKMVMTFKALARHADFKAREEAVRRVDPPEADAEKPLGDQGAGVSGGAPGGPTPIGQARIGALVYSVNLHLPESRDPAVYDALFRSLKEHLLG